MLGEDPNQTDAEGSFSHVFDTPFGRLGVLICYESMLEDVVKRLYQQQPQLVLLLYSAPGQDRDFAERVGTDIEIYDFVLDELPFSHSCLMKAPVISVNMCGPFFSTFPVPFMEESYQSDFNRITKIFDSSSKILASTRNFPLPQTHTIISAEICIPTSTDLPECPLDGLPILVPKDYPSYERIQKFFTHFKFGMSMWELFYGPNYYKIHHFQRRQLCSSLGLQVRQIDWNQIMMFGIVGMTLISSLIG
jgi:hypothetical protein